MGTQTTESMPQSEWWRGAVIYQIYPRSFCDSNGDGIGDLPGITSRLDYIADLGVDAIWISPFFKSPMRDFGYDVSDFCAVDPIFGSLEDFDDLLKQAHKRKLKVIIDQVYSHTSDQCDWFKQSRANRDNAKADWYVWADAKADGSAPNNWESAFWGPAWSWDEQRQQYYLHNFLGEQPDLNLHNPQVQEKLLDVCRFWLDRGVDGFRLDASNYFMHDPLLRDNEWFDEHGIRLDPHAPDQKIYSESHQDIIAFIRRLRTAMDDYPDTFSVAEIGGAMQRENTIAFTSGDNHLNTAYSFVFLATQELSAATIRDELSDWNQLTSNYPSWAFSNHDMPRVVSRWGKAGDPPQLAKMLQMLLLTLRGTVFLYQGEELGLPQSEVPFEKLKDPEAIANWPDILGRDGARTPIPWSGRDQSGDWGPSPWLPIDESHYELRVDKQQLNEDSTLRFCKQLLALRKQYPALISGDIRFIDSPDEILAFTRHVHDESLLCVFNMSREPKQWRPETTYQAAFPQVLIQVGVENTTELAQLSPLSACILKLQ